jgi:hypothetical protein
LFPNRIITHTFEIPQLLPESAPTPPRTPLNEVPFVKVVQRDELYVAFPGVPRGVSIRKPYESSVVLRATDVSSFVDLHKSLPRYSKADSRAQSMATAAIGGPAGGIVGYAAALVGVYQGKIHDEGAMLSLMGLGFGLMGLAAFAQQYLLLERARHEGDEIADLGTLAESLYYGAPRPEAEARRLLAALADPHRTTVNPAACFTRICRYLNTAAQAQDAACQAASECRPEDPFAHTHQTLDLLLALNLREKAEATLPTTNGTPDSVQ